MSFNIGVSLFFFICLFVFLFLSPVTFSPQSLDLLNISQSRTHSDENLGVLISKVKFSKKKIIYHTIEIRN